MGERLPNLPTLAPVPAGNLCVFGWGPVGIFGRGPTPSQCNVHLENIQKGPLWVPADGEPFEGDFTLTQNAFAPCFFAKNIGGVDLIFVNFGVTAALVFVFAPNFSFMFNRNSVLNANLVYSNTVSTNFIGGTCVLTLPEIE